MSAICTEGQTTNSELLAIADRVATAVRLSILRGKDAFNNGSANALPQNSIEKDTFDFLTKYQAVNKAAVARLASLTAGGGRVPRLAVGGPMRAFSSVSFAAPETILDQAKRFKLFDGLELSRQTLAGVEWDASARKAVAPGDNEAYAIKILEVLDFKRIFSAAAPAAPAPSGAKELHLKLTRLRAIRRFGFEVTDWGADHIVCGGGGEDSVQQRVKAPQFFIHDFNRDGEKFNIRPDHTFIKFDLNRAGAWPRGFMAIVFIAEQDASGGFIDFLHLLWNAISAKVVELATSLALAAIGGIAGAELGSAAPIVGTIVGAIIGAALGFIVGWLIDTVKDDIFESSDNPLGVVLPSQNDLFPGNRKRSPISSQDFVTGSARYLMSYYWELVS